MKSLRTGYLVFRGVFVAAVLFFGIYDLLTDDALGWPITISGLLLAGFLVFRIWLARRIRRSKADSVAAE
jgi:membrane protein implicated in regulation of membrane protease activity